MDRISINIEGLAEMKKALDVLPDKFQRQAIMKVERKAARPVIRAARSKLLSYGSNYSNLAKSIGTITAKSRNPIIYAGPRVKGKWKNVGYIARWVEYGTKGIVQHKGRSKSSAGWNDEFVWVGKLKKGSRYRKDQPPKPFMRPAIDQTMETAKSVFIETLKTDLDKHIANLLKKVKR